MNNTLRLWEILVPRKTNDGIEIKVEYHHEWDREIRELTGGLTIMKPVKGQWISSIGKLHAEEMIPVRIYCKEKDIDKIVDLTIQHYDQEAVLAYEISSNVKLKYRTKNK